MRVGAVSPFLKSGPLQLQGKHTPTASRDESIPSTDLQDLREKRRMLSQTQSESMQSESGQKVFQGVSKQNSFIGMQSYTEALRTGREKAKKSSLAVKHVRYQAKSISSQIVRNISSEYIIV